MSITIEKYDNQAGIYILRDDLLPGGTKSILIDSLLVNRDDVNELVYASPCYGGFQIALSIFCKNNNKRATIFCAKRTIRHSNTEICIRNGANIVEVPYGYLSVVEKHAREYIRDSTLQKKKSISINSEGGVLGEPMVPLKIAFGANSPESINIIASRAKRVIETFHTTYGTPPDEIWCAVGSGTLISGIIQAYNEMKSKKMDERPLKIYGVQVGKEFNDSGSNYPNVTILVYPKPFEYSSKLKVNFPSMPNYDLKAFELCLEHNKNSHDNKKVLFWNVL